MEATGFFPVLWFSLLTSLYLPFPFYSKHSQLSHTPVLTSLSHRPMFLYYFTEKFLKESMFPISTSSPSYLFSNLLKPCFCSLDSYSIPKPHISKVIFQTSYWLTSLATSEAHAGWRSSELQIIIFRQWRAIILTVQAQKAGGKGMCEGQWVSS